MGKKYISTLIYSSDIYNQETLEFLSEKASEDRDFAFGNVLVPGVGNVSFFYNDKSKKTFALLNSKKLSEEEVRGVEKKVEEVLLKLVDKYLNEKIIGAFRCVANVGTKINSQKI